jgi:hypothetical protein
LKRLKKRWTTGATEEPSGGAALESEALVGQVSECLGIVVIPFELVGVVCDWQRRDAVCLHTYYGPEHGLLHENRKARPRIGRDAGEMNVHEQIGWTLMAKVNTARVDSVGEQRGWFITEGSPAMPNRSRH